jgi:methionine-S-sulfoxide reductase
MPGVVRTRVGYAGGNKQNPTYHNLGDHTETIQMDFDPRKVSYQSLLDIFWQCHDPLARPWSRQYKSVIFYHDDEQKSLALASRDRLEAAQKRKIHTEMLPAARFYLAEDYHQKYILQGVPELKREYRRIYPKTEDFVNSTAAARVNGYIGGHGRPADLRKDLGMLGLSPGAQERLWQMAQSHNPTGEACPLPGS